MQGFSEALFCLPLETKLKTPPVLLEGETRRKVGQRLALPSPVTTKKARRERYISTRTRAPVHSSCEIPILSVLLKSPSLELPTKVVVKEVVGKWLRELTSTDLGAVYPQSKRKVVETIIKYSRKNLVGKGEIYPAGVENLGIWKATKAGMDRVANEEDKWAPKYVRVFSMIEDEEEKPLIEIL